MATERQRRREQIRRRHQWAEADRRRRERQTWQRLTEDQRRALAGLPPEREQLEL